MHFFLKKGHVLKICFVLESFLFHCIFKETLDYALYARHILSIFDGKSNKLKMCTGLATLLNCLQNSFLSRTSKRLGHSFKPIQIPLSPTTAVFTYDA